METYAHEFCNVRWRLTEAVIFQKIFPTWESMLNNGEVLNYFILLFKVLKALRCFVNDFVESFHAAQQWWFCWSLIDDCCIWFLCNGIVVIKQALQLATPLCNVDSIPSQGLHELELGKSNLEFQELARAWWIGMWEITYQSLKCSAYSAWYFSSMIRILQPPDCFHLFLSLYTKVKFYWRFRILFVSLEIWLQLLYPIQSCISSLFISLHQRSSLF
jgi:hypothetical protein